MSLLFFLRLPSTNSSFILRTGGDRVSGKSWRGVPATVTELSYSRRVSAEGLPLDDEVVFGRIYDSGYLMHVSELPLAEVGTL